MSFDARFNARNWVMVVERSQFPYAVSYKVPGAYLYPDHYIATHLSLEMSWFSQQEDSSPLIQLLIEKMQGIQDLARIIHGYCRLGVWCLLMTNSNEIPDLRFPVPISRSSDIVQARLDEKIHLPLTSGDLVALVIEATETHSAVSINARVRIQTI